LTFGQFSTLEYTGSANDSTNRTIMLGAEGGAVTVSNASTTLTLAGVITGTGTFNVTGPGVVTLSGASNYTGATVIGSGVLRQEGGSRFSNSSAFILSNAPESVLDLNNFNAGIGSLAGGGSAGGTVMLGTTTINVGFDNTSTTFAGTLTGTNTGQLVKVGTGTLTLSGTNTYTGVTSVSAGTLRFSGGNAIADASPLNVSTDGAAEFVNGTETVASLLGSGSVKLTGGNLNVGANNSGTVFAGGISGSGNLTKVGTGTLTLTTSPTYTGTTNVNVGKLVLNGGFDAPGAGINIAAGASLDTRGAVSQSISGSGTITATGTLVIGDGTSTSGFNFGGLLAVGTRQVILSDADLADLGSATLDSAAQLSSPNGIRIATGQGVTTAPGVSATIGGSLINNGVITGPTLTGQSLSLTGDVSGTGSYAGNVRFTNSFSPGNGPATVALQNFTFEPTHTFSLELGGLAAGSQHDRLVFTGAGTVHGNLTVLLIGGFKPVEGNTFTILAGGSLNGSFDSFAFPPLNPGLAWDYRQTASDAILVVVPEPSTAGLLLAAIYLGLGASRPLRASAHA
jgi:autotransporter-associated beta strand protein